MKITIKEVFDDLYELAYQEGYLSGICDSMDDTEDYEEEYHENVLNICQKYIPNYKNFVPEKYFKETNWNDKGVILSHLTEENFREIIYGLMYQGGSKQ